MNEKEFFLDLLMKKKAEMKMLEYIFNSGRQISESKMNAVLDRKRQLEKDIKKAGKEKVVTVLPFGGELKNKNI